MEGRMNGLALCAGHGGLELGLHIAEPGYRTVCYVEREAYQAAALVARMEDQALDNAPVWDDVKTFDGRPWRGRVDIVTGGYPCQPFSTAGKRRGANDPRHIWPDIKRIVEEIGPEWCLFENVANHLNLGFYEVAQDLRSMGYQVAADLVSAKETGASHNRLRLFIVAHRAGQRRGEAGQCGDAEKSGTCQRGSELGDTDSRDQQRYRTGKPDEGQSLAGSGIDVADTQGHDRRRELETRKQATDRRRGPTGNSQGLAVAECNGREQGPEGIRRRQPEPASDGEGMDHASCIGRNARGKTDGGDVGDISDTASELPLFAPGPGNFAAWAAALGAAPMLAPALGPVDLWAIARSHRGLPPVVGEGWKRGMAQGCDKETTAQLKSDVRRMADVLAYRVDRLRGGGNGVSPLAAAYAWFILKSYIEALDRGSAAINVLTETLSQNDAA